MAYLTSSGETSDRYIAELNALFRKEIRPPSRRSLPEWIEENIYLSSRTAPIPGKMKLWKYQRGILEAIGDRHLQRVTVIKSARIGFTKCLIGAIGHYALNRPSSIILLSPTEDDARRFAIDEVEPTFLDSPALVELLNPRTTVWGGKIAQHDTLKYKQFTSGGTLKLLAARSPRNLRAHDAKVLFMDEVDAFEVSSEGDPIALAEKRTLSHDDRKIVLGSTPTVEGISVVTRKYGQSDQRIFEIPCPFCDEYFELQWAHIHWPQDDPRSAYAVCPHCEKQIEEKHKYGMVHDGEWRATRPDVLDHAGFRVNTLISLFENARWGMLAEEFLRAKRGGPAEIQVFENTVLGKAYRTTLDSVDEDDLKRKAEPFGMDDIPDEIVLMTVGCDVQNDRIEVTVVGWSGTNQPYILLHYVVHGSTIEARTWQELDKFLMQKWVKSNGGTIGIEAVAIDSGGTGTGPESRTQATYNFCTPRLWRKVFAIRGVAGPRPVWTPSAGKKANAPKLFLIGVEQVKSEILERLAAPAFIDAMGEPTSIDTGIRNHTALRISDTLPEAWYEQVSSERRIIKYINNRPKITFQPVMAGVRNEALDCLCYALAVRAGLGYVNLRARTLKTPVIKEGVEIKKPPRRLSDFGKLNG